MRCLGQDVAVGADVGQGGNWGEAVGGEDKDDLTKPKAYVTLKNGKSGDDALADELKAFVKGRITPYKYPRWIVFTPELPKKAAGKIQRFKLRELG